MNHEDFPEYPMTTYGSDQKRIRKRVQRIRLPYYTSVEWTAQNPLLQKGEVAIESDTRRMKIGTGVTRWNDLEYVAGSSSSANVAWGEISGTLSQQTDLQNALDGKVNANQGAENSGKVLVIDEQGNVVVGEGGSGGGMASITHDESLAGNGTVSSPLKISSAVRQEIAAKASVTYVDNQIAATVTGYENADREINNALTTLGNKVNTLRTDHDDLGEQVSSIESKIPGTTTENNPLVNESRLLAEEMDIRSDLNAFQSELQTQINAQAAKVTKNEDDIQALTLNKQDKLIPGANITIVDNVISATGGGSGGEGGISSVTHNNTLTGDGTPASPLGVNTNEYWNITTTQAKLNEKQATITAETDLTAQSLTAEEVTVSTQEGTFNVSITAGVATIATNNGLDIAAQTKFDTAPTTDDTTAWANVNSTAFVTKAQVTSALTANTTIIREWA